MHFSRTTALPALVLALLLGVVACSGDAATTQVASPADVTSPTEAVAQTEAPPPTTAVTPSEPATPAGPATPGETATATAAPPTTPEVAPEPAAPATSAAPVPADQLHRATVAVDGVEVALVSACGDGEQDVIELDGGVLLTMPWGGAAEMTITSPQGEVEATDVEMVLPSPADDVIALTATIPPGSGIDGNRVLVERNVVLDPCTS